MHQPAKIRHHSHDQSRRSGEAAIFLLVLFGLLSMLGLVRADDDPSDRRRDRSERQSNDGARRERSATSLTVDTPRRNPSVAPQSNPETLLSVPRSTTRQPFAPQFTFPSDNERRRMTAEKEPSTPRTLKSSPTLQDRPPTNDPTLRIHRGRTPSNENLTPTLKRQTPTVTNSLPVAPMTDKTQPRRELKTPRLDALPKIENPPRRLKTSEGTDQPSLNSSKKIPLTEKQPREVTTPERTRDRKSEDSQPKLRIDRIPNATKSDLRVSITREPKKGEGNLPSLNKSSDNKPSVERVKVNLDDKLKLSAEQREKIAAQHHLDHQPNRHLKNELSRLPIEKNGRILETNLKRLNLKPQRQPDLQDRLQSGQLLPLTNSRQAKSLLLRQQWVLHDKGDVARRMNLSRNLHLAGGWRHRKMGHVSPMYTRHCLTSWYTGPSFCPTYCWYPVWSPWVDWCSWDYVADWCDPRPIYCRPVVWNPCPTWTWWACPTWQPLPIVTCGTWIDVPPVVVNDVDLQLLAVRFVDPGHIQQERGPRYRAWVRNNTPRTITQPFNVMLFASDDSQLLVNRSEAGVRVDRIEAGQTMSFDIRLPEGVNNSSLDEQGNPVPFRYLTAQIDSHRELADVDPLNNGSTMERGAILPVDPASFAADPLGTSVGSIVNIAGEGFGPEPGQVLVQIGELELQGEIEGWYDLGVRVRLPSLPLASSTTAQVVVVRGDGAAANPLALEVAPVDSLVEAPVSN